MKKVFITLCMAAAVASLSSCASSKQAATVADLSGEWDIIEINGTAVVPAPQQEFPYIGFDVQEGRVSGNSGCNRIIGSFDLNARPGTIDLGALGSTRMMCPDMTLEQNVLQALSQTKKYKKLGDNHIALCGSSTKRPIIVLQKRKAASALSLLEGRWNITEACGKAIVQGMEKQPFVEFDIPGKKLHGNAGCNLINGTFQTDNSHASSLSFPNLISTMMACPDMEVESRILKAFNETKTFGQLPEGGIGLYDAAGTRVMVLNKDNK